MIKWSSCYWFKLSLLIISTYKHQRGVGCNHRLLPMDCHVISPPQFSYLSFNLFSLLPGLGCIVVDNHSILLLPVQRWCFPGHKEVFQGLPFVNYLEVIHSLSYETCVPIHNHSLFQYISLLWWVISSTAELIAYVSGIFQVLTSVTVFKHLDFLLVPHTGICHSPVRHLNIGGEKTLKKRRLIFNSSPSLPIYRAN
jgi:hypothetical protein